MYDDHEFPIIWQSWEPDPTVYDEALARESVRQIRLIYMPAVEQLHLFLLDKAA